SADSGGPSERPSPGRWPSSQVLPERVPDEAANTDVFADRGDSLVDQLAYRPLLVAKRLLVEADLGIPLLQLTIDDLGTDRLGLLLGRLVREELGALGHEIRLGDPVGVDVQRGKAGHLDREVANQALELVRP